MISELAEQQLKKAGWYPDRKVDVFDQIEFWESLGYQTFDAAVKFMEEFGKLHITDKYIFTVMNSLHEDHHTTFVTEILKFYNEYTDEEKFEFNLFGQVKEKILPVLELEDGIVFFIGESGVFYCDGGLIAENSEVFWNERYNNDYSIALPFSKIGTGEERKHFVRNSVCKYL